MPRQIERVIPIFGEHDMSYMVSRKAESLQESVRRGKFVDKHVWNAWTIKEVRRLKPRVLSIDSIHGDGSSSLKTLQNVFLLSPINPFQLRKDGKDAFIIGGDICCASSNDPVVQSVFDVVVADKMNAFYMLGPLPDGISETNDLRNALITVKLKDAVALLPNEQIEDDPVAVLGNGHEEGCVPDVWTSLSAQLGCIRSTLTRLFDEAFTIGRNAGIEVNDKTMNRYLKGFNKMIGTLDIWRITKATSLDVDEVMRNIVLERSVVSPTFANLAEEVGQNTLAIQI